MEFLEIRLHVGLRGLKLGNLKCLVTSLNSKLVSKLPSLNGAYCEQGFVYVALFKAQTY